MRRSLTVVLALTGVFVLASTGFGRQAGAYKPDGWQGLTLDQSTPEDAVRALGRPVSDRSDRLRVYNIDAWITPRHKQKIFRVLTHEKVGDAKRVRLAFLDNRLVRIFIEYDEKKFPAKDLREKLGVDFVLVDGKVPSDSTPSQYEGQAGRPAPERYPAAYFMVGVTPRSMISAFVGRGGIKGALEQANRLQTKEPGSLLHLDMLSRTLAKGGRGA